MSGARFLARVGASGSLALALANQASCPLRPKCVVWWDGRQSLGARGAKRYRASMWPPEAMHITHGLRSCQRLLPHVNNTGGFFVAILRKTRALPGADGSRLEGAQQQSPAGDAPRPSRPVTLIRQSGPVLWRLSAQETCSLLALDDSHQEQKSKARKQTRPTPPQQTTPNLVFVYWALRHQAAEVARADGLPASSCRFTCVPQHTLQEIYAP